MVMKFQLIIEEIELREMIIAHVFGKFGVKPSASQVRLYLRGEDGVTALIDVGNMLVPTKRQGADA